MKNFKKLMITMVTAVMTVAMAGCGANSPTKVVEKALNNIKAGNAQSISEMINNGTSENSTSEYTESSEKMVQAIKKIDYKVNSEVIDGDSAKVVVSLNGPDLATVISEFMQKAFADAFSEAFSGVILTEEETNAKYDKMLSELLDKVNYTDRTMDINLVKTNGEWTLKDENELVKLVMNINPDAFNDSNDDTSSNDSSAKAQIQEMTLNTPLEVSTDEGNYKITIEGVRTTEERNQFSELDAKKVIFLDYNYENVSYGEASGDDLYIGDYSFQVLDDEGNVLDTYPVSDDTRYAKQTPAGGKCKATATYAITTDSKNVSVTYKDGGQKLGKIVIPVQ